MAKYLYQTLTSAGGSCEIRSVDVSGSTFTFSIDMLFVAQHDAPFELYYCPTIKFCHQAVGGGHYALQCMTDGVQLLLQDGTEVWSEWGATDYGTPIGGPAVNWEIRKTGTSITIARNGVDIFTVVDATYSTGYVVLRQFNSSGQWDNADGYIVDDFESYAIEPWNGAETHGEWTVLFGDLDGQGIAGTSSDVNLTGTPSTQANQSSSGALSTSTTLTGTPSTQANQSSSGALSTSVSLTGSPSTQANESSSGAISTSVSLTGTPSTQVNRSPAGAITIPSTPSSGSNPGFGGGGGGTARRLDFSDETRKRYGEDDPLDAIMREILDPPVPAPIPLEVLQDAVYQLSLPPNFSKQMADVEAQIFMLQRRLDAEAEAADEEDFMILMETLHF